MKRRLRPVHTGPIFYGWFIVAASGAMGAMMIAMAGPNFGLFVTPMTRDLEVGQAYFGGAFAARIVGVAVTAPLLGRVVDRIGPRVPLAVSGVLGGLMTAALGLVDSGWQIVTLFFLLGATGTVAGLSLYVNVPLANWFVRKRGRAMAVAFAGVPVGAAVSTPLTAWAIEAVGWRQTWMLIGLVAGAVIAVLGLLVMRRRPEDMGLSPDGVQVPAADQNPGGSGAAHPASAGPREEYSWVPREAVRTRAFWVLALVFGFMFFGQGSLSVFRVPYFVERGLDSQLLALALTVDALVSGALSLTLGLFIDRMRPRLVTIAGLVAMTCSFVVALLGASAAHMFASLLLFGIGLSTSMVVQNAIWPHYFGRTYIGSVRGMSMPLTLLFSAAGGPLTGILRDVTGQFLAAWSIAVAGLLLGVVLLAWAPRPRRP